MRLLGLAGLCLFACASRAEEPSPRLPARSAAPERAARTCPERVALPPETERFTLEPLVELAPARPFAFEFVEPKPGATVDALGLERTAVVLGGLEHLSENGPHKVLVGVDAYRARPLTSGRALTLAELVPFGVTLAEGWHQVSAALVSERGDIRPFAGRPRGDSVLVRRFLVGGAPRESGPAQSMLVYNSPTGTYHLAAKEALDAALEPFLDFGSVGSAADGSIRVLVEVQGAEVRHVALADQGGSYRLPLLESGDYRVTLTQAVAGRLDAACVERAPAGESFEVIQRMAQTITINREQTPHARR